MATHLKRSIYIGAGGTGVETVLQVRKYYQSLNNGELPPMIKCLFIDTDENQVKSLDASISADEIFSLVEPNALTKYKANENKYAKYPNMSTIRAIKKGAGQSRSHGRFALMCKENVRGNVQQSFSDKFRSVRNSVLNIHVDEGDRFFDILGTDLDVHLVFSMSGGTGAGTFLSIAYLIREIDPNCTIVAYAFSPSFFEGLPIKSKVKQNTYSSLLELDYCMRSDEIEHQDVLYPKDSKVQRAPFDVVMYIDNKSYTRDGHALPHVYPVSAKKQIERIVAFAMAIASGEMGVATDSVLDNLKQDILCGDYEVTFKESNEIKPGWVSSLGVSEIKCKTSTIQSSFARNLAIRILGMLSTGKASNLPAATEAFEWVTELDLDESGKAGHDHDSVVNAIVNPDEFSGTEADEIDKSSIEDGKVRYFNRVKENLTDKVLTNRKNDLVEKKKREIVQKVVGKLFPNSTESYGLVYLSNIITQLGDYFAVYSVVLGKEKEEKIKELNELKKSWALNKKKLEKVNNAVFSNTANIQSLENSLRAIAQEWFVCDMEIARREKAIKVFEELKTFVNSTKETLDSLKNRIDKALLDEEEKIKQVQVESPISNEWGAIDLTKFAEKLPIVNPSQVIYNLSDFYAFTGYGSLSDLSGCQTINSIVERFSEKVFVEQVVGVGGQKKTLYPIINVLMSLSKEDLDYYLSEAVKYSNPLMDIQVYGEDVNVVEHVYIAVPGGEQCDNSVKRVLQDHLAEINAQPEWVDINDPNRILIYRQIGVIPPYFISGISKGSHGISFSDSCQEAFELRYGKSSYVPFSDIQFDELYSQKSYRLYQNKQLSETEKQKAKDENLFVWMKAIVFGLIKSTEEGYFVCSENGKMDLHTFIRWEFIGDDRREAYDSFEKNQQHQRFISGKLKDLFSDQSNKTKWESYRGNPERYAKEFMLENLDGLKPEVEDQYRKELEAL